ncbi:MAG: hypothetical protein NVS2B2_37430 [Ktedonobacteraceae bacterium]
MATVEYEAVSSSTAKQEALWTVSRDLQAITWLGLVYMTPIPGVSVVYTESKMHHN